MKFLNIIENLAKFGVFDILGIKWQIAEWYQETIHAALMDKNSVKTLVKFYDAIENNFEGSEIESIISKYSSNSEKDNSDGFFAKFALAIQKSFNKKESLEKRDAAILLLCLYKNINAIEDAPYETDEKQKLREFLLNLHKVMQKYIYIIFDLLGGKNAVVYSTFFTSLSVELNQMKELIKAGVYKNQPILELDENALVCAHCGSEGQLKIVEENGIILVKAFCPNCGRVTFPNFALVNPNLEKGTGELTDESVQEVLYTFADAIHKKLDKIIALLQEWMQKGLIKINAGGDFDFYLTKKGAIVVDCNLVYEDIIEIPKEYDGKPVIALGVNLFLECDPKKIIIPNSVRCIGDDCFWNCGKLRTIEFNGTKQEWKKINFGKGCFGGVRLKVHFIDGRTKFIWRLF